LGKWPQLSPLGSSVMQLADGLWELRVQGAPKPVDAVNSHTG
jgi:hypothetical protein